MARRRNPVGQFLIRYATLAFGGCTAHLPLSLSRPMARGLARLAYYVVPRLRKVGYANLDLAYGDTLTRAEKQQILIQAIENIATVAVEFSHIPRIDEAFIEKHVTLKGLDNLERNRGHIIICGHIGNWEWMPNVVTRLGFKGALVSRPLNDPRLDAYIDDIRTSQGAHTLYKAGAWEKILEHIEDGWLVGIMVDQSPHDNGVPSSFFGQPCWATVGPMLAARRTNAPVHAVSMLRTTNGGYTLEFSPRIPLVNTGDKFADLVENTQRCQDTIEAQVRHEPGQWLWLHRRWKTRPRLDEEWKARLEQYRAKEKASGD